MAVAWKTVFAQSHSAQIPALAKVQYKREQKPILARTQTTHSSNPEKVWDQDLKAEALEVGSQAKGQSPVSTISFETSGKHSLIKAWGWEEG